MSVQSHTFPCPFTQKCWGFIFLLCSHTPLTVCSSQGSISQVSIHQRPALKLFWQVKSWDSSRDRLERSRNVRSGKAYSLTHPNLLSADGTVFFKKFLCTPVTAKEWKPECFMGHTYVICMYIYPICTAVIAQADKCAKLTFLLLPPPFIHQN